MSDIDRVAISGDDDVSEDDTHFVIYSKIAIEKTLRNVSNASTFTAEYWEEVVQRSRRLTLLNELPEMTCKLLVPSDTCVRIGQSNHPVPNRYDFLAMFSLSNGKNLLPESGALTSFCSMASFEVFKEQRTMTSSSMTSVDSFCSVDDSREISIKTEDRDEVYYLRYRLDDSASSPRLAVSFAIPVWGEYLSDTVCDVTHFSPVKDATSSRHPTKS